MQPRRPQVQRAPSSSTTMWPISPAPPRPAPRLAVEDQPAADAGPPEDPEQRAERPARAELELGHGRDLDVVAERHRQPSSPFSVSAEREGAFPAGQVARARDRAALDDARASRRRRPRARRARRRPPAAASRSAVRHRAPRRPRGRPRSASGAASRAEHVVVARRRRPPGSSCRRGRCPPKLAIGRHDRRAARAVARGSRGSRCRSLVLGVGDRRGGRLGAIFGAGIAPTRATSCVHCSGLRTLVVTTGAGAVCPRGRVGGAGRRRAWAAGGAGEKTSSMRFQYEGSACVLRGAGSA